MNVEILEHRFADTTTVESAQRSGRSSEIPFTELSSPERYAVCRYVVDERELLDRLKQCSAS